MIDRGDVYQVAVDIRDSSGTLTNPSTATLTITLPDGTTTSPTVSLPPAETGKLRVDYLTVQAGRHSFSLVTTVPNTSYSDTFDVRPADPGFIISLQDTKAQLNITSSVDDEELRSFIEAATRVVEGHVGAVVRQTYTGELRDGGQSFVQLLHYPVISVASVTESGVTLAASGYSLREATGRLYRVSGYNPLYWLAGTKNISVTYVAGQAVIPANVTQAAKIIIQHLWETQRSRDVRRPPTALAGEFAQDSNEVGRMFSIPHRALELLRNDRQIAVA